MHIPEELLEELQRGNVIPLVGSLINHGVLPTLPELAKTLARRCDYPPGEKVALGRVASYYLLTTHDRHGLITFLRDRLDRPDVEPSRSHRLIIRLRPPVVMTSCYDGLMARAAQEAQIAYTPVIRNEQVAYSDGHKMMLVWLRGILDQPDSVIVTEEDHRRFLSGRESLSDLLRGELARRTWLFIGMGLEEEWFPHYYDSVTEGLDHHRRRAYVVGSTTSAFSRAWWSARGQILDAEIEAFLEELVRQVEARRQPAQRRAEQPEIGEATASAPLPQRPYKLLDFFAEDDAAIFFGRETEIQTLTSRIHAHRLTLLYGASGAGKTSLLLAGVVPRLTHGDTPYELFYLRALESPDAVIRNAILRRCPNLQQADSLSLVDLVDSAAENLASTLVIIIDQFEEFFIRFSRERRQNFIAELGALHDARDVPVKIVLSLREDWLAEVNEIRERIPEVFYVDLRLLPLTRTQARQAIIGPAQRIGIRYDPSLVERLLDDLTQETSRNESAFVMPPQLQLICDALYEQVSGEGRTYITTDDYEYVGGIKGILERYIEEALQEHHGPNRQLARDVLTALVTSRKTKAGLSNEDLSVELGVARHDLNPILSRLVGQRLLRRLEEGQSYELAHDTLAATLAGWIGEEEQRRKRVREMLRQEVRDWRNDPTIILAKAKFEQVNAIRDDLRLSAEEAQFLLRAAVHYDNALSHWLERMEEAGARLEVLLEMLHGEPAARLTAAKTLERFPQQEVGVALAQAAVQDADANVRSAAATSLARSGNTRGISRLLDQAQDNHSRDRTAALQALALIKECAPQHLTAPRELRRPLALALSRIRWRRGWPAIRAMVIAGGIGGAVAFSLGLGPSLGYHAVRTSSMQTLIFLISLLSFFGLFAGALMGLGLGAINALLAEQTFAGPVFGGIVFGASAFNIGLFPFLGGGPAAEIALEFLARGLLGSLVGVGISVPLLRSQKPKLFTLIGGTVGGGLGLFLVGPLALDTFQTNAVPPLMRLSSGSLTGLILALAFVRVAPALLPFAAQEGNN